MFLAIHSCNYKEPPNWDLDMHKYSFLNVSITFITGKYTIKQSDLKNRVQNIITGNRIQSLDNHIYYAYECGKTVLSDF